MYRKIKECKLPTVDMIYAIVNRKRYGQRIVRSACNKTVKSTRYVNLPEYIYQLIQFVPHNKDTDHIINVTPNTIRKRFKKLLRQNGIEDIRFHDCRHIFASTATMLNVPEKYAMEMGE